MYLTRHRAAGGPRWALDGRYLPADFALDRFLAGPVAGSGELEERVTDEAAGDPPLAPVEDGQEVWAAGVTYRISREARMFESEEADIYAKVYDAVRPELFFKAAGWRVAGPGQRIRVRGDSRWNVPEPELVLVVNSAMEIVGYTAGNDVSSRDIEGENSLYLPQAKVYDGCCSLGPGILLDGADAMRDLPIKMEVERGDEAVFEGEISTSEMRRPLEELAAYLGRELSFPGGAFLMTGTSLVPAEDFNLSPGDRVRISVGALVLENEVAG